MTGNLVVLKREREHSEIEKDKKKKKESTKKKKKVARGPSWLFRQHALLATQTLTKLFLTPLREARF
jgi:hypothetical protein